MLSSSSIDSIRKTATPTHSSRRNSRTSRSGSSGSWSASRVYVTALKRAAPWILAASIVLLFLVAVTPLGHASGGNRNWFRWDWVTAQPSEAAKLALALYLGVALSQLRPRLTTAKQAIVPAGLVAALVVGLVLAGKDVGTGVVMILLVAAAYWTAGVPVRFFALGTAAVGGVVAISSLPRRPLCARDRLAVPDCGVDACWQVTHGTWALASGGIWGLGPGLSREKWSVPAEGSQ